MIRFKDLKSFEVREELRLVDLGSNNEFGLVSVELVD
jgi:hypothetical protein